MDTSKEAVAVQTAATNFRVCVQELENSPNRISYLKSNCLQAYELLQTIKLTPNAFSQSKLTTIFLPKFTNKIICTNKINYYFVCLTCKQDPQLKICSDCFQKEKHKNHNFSTLPLTTSVECQCCFSISNALCQKHIKKFDYLSFANPSPQLYSYISFLAEFLDIILKGDQKSRAEKYKKIIEEMFIFVKLLNQYSLSYNIATAHCFSLNTSSSQSQTFLESLIMLSSQNILPNIFDQLLKCLCNYQPFQILLAKSFFAVNPNKCQLGSIFKIQAVLSKFYKSLYVLGALAEKNIILGSSQPAKLLYCSALQNIKNYTDDEKRQKAVVSIGRTLVAKLNNISIIFNQQMCISISSEFGLIYKIIQFLIKFKQYRKIEEKKSDSEWFNMIVRIVLHAMRGDIDQFPSFFKQFNKDSLKNFISQYFKEIIRNNNKSKFNNLTIICLFKTAENYGLLDLFSKLNENHLPQKNNKKKHSQISCLKFSQNALIFLRNLVASKHHSTVCKLQIANHYKNNILAHQYRMQLVEWFRDFLFMRKQIPLSIIISLEQSGVINFDQAKNVLLKETEFVRDKNMFIYVGPDRNVDPDLSLYNIKELTQFYNFKYDEQSDLYYSDQRAKIIEALIGQAIGKVDIKHFYSNNLNNRYKISFTAVLLDKLVKGRNKNIKQYVQKLKDLNIKSKKINNQTQRLFSIKRIQKQAKMQQMIQIQKQVIKNESNQKSEMKNTMAVSSTSLGSLQQSTSTPSKAQKMQTQSQRKRANKMNKLKEKFNKKSSRYLGGLQKEQQKQEQRCLICREPKSNQDSFLYYLGSVKGDEAGHIMLGLQQNQKIINSCFHAYHQKCLSKSSSNNTCILCKFNGNFLLPVLSSKHCSQFFTKVWWDDFLQLPSFTPNPPAQTYYYGSYYNYNYNNTAQTKSPETTTNVSLTTEQRWTTNFMTLYSSVIVRLGPMAVKGSWENAVKKNKYFYSLIRCYWGKLKAKQELRLKQCIETYEDRIKNSSQMTEYVRDLLLLASQAFLAKLSTSTINQQAILESIKTSSQRVLAKYPQKFTTNFTQNMQWLLDCQFQNGKVESEEIKTLSKQLILHLYNLDLPATVEQLYSMREQCGKCNSMSAWYCLFCRARCCRRCENLQNHCKNNHNGTSILVIFLSTAAIAQITPNSTNEKVIYYDFLHRQFSESNSLLLKQYKYEQSLAYQFFQKVIKIL